MKLFDFLSISSFFLTSLIIGQNNFGHTQINSYNQLEDLYYGETTSLKDKVKYANLCIKKGKEEKSDIHIARGYCWLAMTFYERDDQRALKYLDKAIDYTRNSKNSKFPMVLYLEKADVLRRTKKFKEAINNYILAKKTNYSKSLDNDYNIKLNIAVINSNELGEVSEALILLRECYKYYDKKVLNDSKYSNVYCEVLFDISESFRTLKETDSASYYNKIGYSISRRINDSGMNNLFILSEGENQTLKGNYKNAIDSIKKALPKLKEEHDVGNILSAYYYLGKSYEGLKQKELAVKNFIKVDSIYFKDKRMIPEFLDSYQYLINHYRSVGNNKRQLEYLSKYISIDSTLQINYKEITKLLKHEYDIPKMIDEKERIIKSLRNQNVRYYFGLALMVIIILGLVINQLRLKNIYRKRFDRILSSNNLENKINLNIEVSKISASDKEIGISVDLVNNILKLLGIFEESKGFLRSNITIQTLADEFDTNGKYLSKIVNEYKKNSFVQYINDLRIEYAINILRDDQKFRKYTLQALSSEFGFNSPESFSKAFLKKTGIKPSYFIKELNKA
jgi:AraC-like DNA-binding protein